VAQLVYACTQFPGVIGVQVLVDGEPAEVPTGEGKLTSRPLTRFDFPTLGPG